MWDKNMVQYVLLKLRCSEVLKNSNTLEFNLEPSNFAANLCIF